MAIPHNTPKQVGASYEVTRRRFDQEATAALYATRHGGHRRDRREQRCISRALAVLPAGSTVLDLPCGAGRLAPLLVGMGFSVTAADYSPHMVEQARRAWFAYCADHRLACETVKFDVRDVLASKYEDDAFEAVICNRLLHHFSESETRIIALRELARISRRCVVVSFFNSFALDAPIAKMRNFLHGRISKDRTPISMKQFLADAGAAGLALEQHFPTRWGISPQWYLRLRKVVNPAHAAA